MSGLPDLDLDALASTAEEVRALSRPEREWRVRDLCIEAELILDAAIESLIVRDGRRCAGVVILFSGGNDSTVLAHLMRARATHAAHANTGVGVEKTRQFVRDVCAAWKLPLLERISPRIEDRYVTLVLERGFPGPGQHYKMFQRLKERALEQVRREIVKNGHRERVVFLAGRRRTESKRRAAVPESERRGSTVWVSPLVNWTKPDMSMYRRLRGDVPLNEVSDLIHMSGECLCGAFAHYQEREEISTWFPEAFEQIEELELAIADRDDIPAHAKHWGWGGDPAVLAASRTKAKPKSGMLCTSCDERRDLALTAARKVAA